MVQWGILILVVFCTGIIAMYSYQQFQHEAMVKLAVEKQTQDETKTVSDGAVKEEHKTIIGGAVKNIFAEKLKAVRALLVGKWQSEKYARLFIEFEEDGQMKVIRDGGSIAFGQWSLQHIRLFSSNGITRDTSNIITLTNDTNIGKWRNKVINVDAEQLILEDYCVNLSGSVMCEDRNTEPILKPYKRIVVIEPETE